MQFCTEMPELGSWDPDKLTSDLESLLTNAGYSWLQWQEHANISNPRSEFDGLQSVDMNLTANSKICRNLDEMLWKYSGLAQYDIPVTDNDMHEIIPSLHNTYLGSMLDSIRAKLGPIRARLHNRVDRTGLYWHTDRHRSQSYHLALWGNPGHVLLWSEDYFDWSMGFNSKLSHQDFKIHAKYIPTNGMFYQLRTNAYLHAVANVGVGWREKGLTSRCHVNICPVDPSLSRL